MATAILKPGDRITEYVLEEKVGQGGFGDRSLIAERLPRRGAGDDDRMAPGSGPR